MKIYAIFVCLFFCDVVLTAKVFSCDEYCRADQQYEKATHAYQEKNYVKAVGHLTQALLLNPAHLQAKIKLQDIASFEGDLSASRMKIVRIQELLNYIAFVEKQIVSWQGKMAQGQEMFDLGPTYEKENLDDLILALVARKKNLVSEFFDLKSQENIQSRHAPASPRLSSPESDLPNFKDQLAFLRKEVNVLKDNMAKSDQKISLLTDDLAKKSLEAFEKDTLLTEQKQNFASLQTSLQEAEERLNLVQRIMQEKDVKVQAMEKDLKTMQAFTDQYSHSNEENFAAFKREFSQVQDQLVEQLLLNQQRISSLEQLLAQQQKKLVLLNTVNHVKGKKIDQMNELLMVRNKQVRGMAEVIESKDDTLLEFDGIVDIYRAKLIQANKLLQEKIERIRKLEKQSADLER